MLLHLTKMRLKQMRTQLVFVGVFAATFAYFVYLNASIYGTYADNMYANWSSISEKLQSKYLNILRYNLNLDTSPELIKNACNYEKSGPRILCAVFTRAISHKTKLKAVHDTWAKRCDKLVYMTGPKSAETKDDPDMPFVYLNITDTLERLTLKHLQVYNRIRLSPRLDIFELKKFQPTKLYFV